MITTTHDLEAERRPARLTLRKLIEQGDGEGGKGAEGNAHRPLDLSTPLDRSRYFLCPSVTPLYYTVSYR